MTPGSGSGALRPLIGLTGRGRRAAQVVGLPAAWDEVPVEVHFGDYSAKVAEAGGLPVMLTSAAPIDALADRLDGLVLTGGSDVAPRRYGQEEDADLGVVEPDRDEFELTLLDAMAARGRPVLGICRGLQMINVWSGGSLHQHVPEHLQLDHPPEKRVHVVKVDPATPFGRRYPGEISVNTYHHQTIDEVGDGLVVVGRAPDGVIEMIEHEQHRMVAVQWHPELLDDLDPAFTWLVDEARRQDP
jgi:putative glutamine amidotransferase